MATLDFRPATRAHPPMTWIKGKPVPPFGQVGNKARREAGLKDAAKRRGRIHARQFHTKWYLESLAKLGIDPISDEAGKLFRASKKRARHIAMGRAKVPKEAIYMIKRLLNPTQHGADISRGWQRNKQKRIMAESERLMALLDTNLDKEPSEEQT